MEGTSPESGSIRVYVHTAIDGYAWQGVPPALAQSLQSCLDAAGTFPGASSGRARQAAGGAIRCSLSGVRGTAVYRYHRRIAGDFRGRDSHYVALAFFPADFPFDLRKVWSAPAMGAPAEGAFESLALAPGDWRSASGPFRAGSVSEKPVLESVAVAVSGPDAPERIAAAFQGETYGAGALNCPIFVSPDGAMEGELVYEVFPEIPAVAAAKKAFFGIPAFSTAERRKKLEAWRAAVSALEAKASRLSSFPALGRLAAGARADAEAAASAVATFPPRTFPGAAPARPPAGVVFAPRPVSAPPARTYGFGPVPAEREPPRGRRRHSVFPVVLAVAVAVVSSAAVAAFMLRPATSPRKSENPNPEKPPSRPAASLGPASQDGGATSRTEESAGAFPDPETEDPEAAEDRIRADIEILVGDARKRLDSVEEYRAVKESPLPILFYKLDVAWNDLLAAKKALDRHCAEAAWNYIDETAKKIEAAGPAAKAEAERKAQEAAERLTREEEARQAREEEARKAREEAERQAREEAERKKQEAVAKAEAARKEKEAAERKAAEERKAAAEAERRAREAAAAAKAEAERKSAAAQPRPDPKPVAPKRISERDMLVLRQTAVESVKALGALAPPKFGKKTLEEESKKVQDLRRDGADADYSGSWLFYSGVTNECFPVKAKLDGARQSLRDIRETDAEKAQAGDVYRKAVKSLEIVENFVARPKSGDRQSALKRLDEAADLFAETRRRIEAKEEREREAKERAAREKEAERNLKREFGKRLESVKKEFDSLAENVYEQCRDAGLSRKASNEIRDDFKASEPFEAVQSWLDRAKRGGGRDIDGRQFPRQECLEAAERWLREPGGASDEVHKRLKDAIAAAKAGASE